MKKILLAFNGSAEARYAAEVSWMLARRSGCSVTAQHVINTFAVWNFLQFSLSGFTGSGPFFSAFETICQSLRTLGVSLTDVYSSHIDSLGIDGAVVTDEGETLSEIKKRASVHDLAIVGRRRFSLSRSRGVSPQSLCESLVREIDCPLLIVQRPCPQWQRLRILTGTEILPDSSIKAIFQFSSLFKMEPELYYVGNCSRNWEELHTLLLVCASLSEEKDINVEQISPGTQMSVPDSALVVVPTLQTESGRVSFYDGDLERLLHSMDLPAILIWPSGSKSSGEPTQNRTGLSTSAGQALA